MRGRGAASTAAEPRLKLRQPWTLQSSKRGPRRPLGSNQLSLVGLGAGVDFLRGPHRGSILDVLPGDLCQHVLQSAENTDRVEIVLVADVRDAEQLPLHLALAVGYDRVEGLAKLFHDLSRVESFRSTDRCQRRRRRG